MAKLAIEGMEFHAFHGFYEDERKAGGRFGVDVYIELPEDTGTTDLLADTVNYEAVYNITSTVIAEPVHLIEHLARRLLDRYKAELGHSGAWTVRVRKFNPPLAGVVDQTHIELKG